MSAKEVAEGLKNLAAPTVNWVNLDQTKISTYFGFSDDILSDFSGYLNSAEENFDIIAVFVFENDKDKDKIMKGISSIVTQMSESYNLANKTIADKINSYVVAEKKDTIIFYVMETNDKISNFITDEVDAKIIIG